MTLSGIVGAVLVPIAKYPCLDWAVEPSFIGAGRLELN